MKDILTKNIGLKILSVIIAILVWMVVVNISNPEIKATRQVPVEVENDSVILNAGKTYEFTGSTTVTVSFSVRTRDEYKIKSSDFRAYVDMEDLYDVTGSVPVKVEVLNNKDVILDASANPSVLRVRVEDVIKTTKDIEYELDGEPMEGYAIGSVVLSPSSITMSGPASQVSQVKTIKILIDVDGISEDVEGTAIPLFVDASGRTIDVSDSDIVVNHTTVNYRLTTLVGKAVPVQYEVGGSPAPGYSFTGVEGSIKEVVVRGSKAQLAEVNSIRVPAEVLDLGGTAVNKTVEVDLSRFVPGGLKIVSDYMSTVVMKVEGQEERHFTINNNQIAVTNVTEGLEYLVEPITIGVVLGGLRSDLDALDAREILGSVDVSGLLEAGVYPVDIIFTLPAGYSVRSYTPVTVKVTGYPVITTEETAPELPQETEAEKPTEYHEEETVAQDESESESKTEHEKEHSGEAESHKTHEETETEENSSEAETDESEASGEN